MRLIIDGQRLNPSRTGVGRCLESLLDDWARSGWPIEPAVLALRDPRAAGRYAGRPGLEVRILRPRSPGLAWEVFGLGRLLRPGDLLLAPANLIPPNWRGPSVLILYDTLPWSAAGGIPRHVRWRFAWRYRLAARRASRIVVPSEATARDVVAVHGIPPARITVCYPGPEPCFRPSPASAPEVRHAREALGLGDRPYFLFVGKRSARRNVPAILAAFDSARARLPAAALVFVGPAGGAALPTGDPAILDGGHVPEPVLRGLLADATALLYPSTHEGFGLPVVEAQASGCPVVTLRNGALIESAGEAAVALDAPEPGLLAEAMIRLATDAGFRTDLIGRGLANAARFPRSAFAGGVKRAIRGVAEEAQAGG